MTARRWFHRHYWLCIWFYIVLTYFGIGVFPLRCLDMDSLGAFCEADRLWEYRWSRRFRSWSLGWWTTRSGRIGMALKIICGGHAEIRRWDGCESHGFTFWSSLRAVVGTVVWISCQPYLVVKVKRIEQKMDWHRALATLELIILKRRCIEESRCFVLKLSYVLSHFVVTLSHGRGGWVSFIS